MIFGFLQQILETEAVAVAFIMSWQAEESGQGTDHGMAVLAGFRRELYCSLGMRRDVLSGVCDALACRPERVHMLAELCLEPECRRGHGAVYDALNSGEVVIGRLRGAVAAVPLRPWGDGRIRLACDVSYWLRPDAESSPERLFCHCCARGKRRPPGTAPRPRRPGDGFTSGSPPAPARSTTRASCLSSRAPSSASRSVTCPDAGTLWLWSWTRPKLRSPEAADRWTWLVIAACAQSCTSPGPSPPVSAF